MAVSFKGGLKVCEKKPTQGLEAKPLMPCEYHRFVLNEHNGASISPVVIEGEYINMGDKLADAEEYTALPVHSSVSGIVKEIQKDESGQAVSILVQNDRLYTKSEDLKKFEYDKLTAREKLWIIREAGIIDMDKTPAHLKLAPQKAVKYLVINGAESNPNITAKCRRMVENAKDIINGIKIASDLLGVKSCTIGIENNMHECISAIKPLIRFNEQIDILVLQAKYPQDNEKVLIKTLTGKSVKIGKKPEDIGVVCLDIETVYNIGRVFRTGMPVIERIVTVGGNAVKDNDNFIVPTGVSAEFLFESVGGFIKKPEIIAMGGIMNGRTVTAEETVTRTSDAFLAIDKAEKSMPKDCVHCGKCVKACPMQLMPYKLNKLAKSENVDAMLRYHCADCIECGLCTFVCPSKIDIVGNIRRLKSKTGGRSGVTGE